MSRKEKILKRLLSMPKDFSWQELTQLLNSIGYSEIKLGKTSGSRVAFFNENTQHIIRLHKPHPDNNLKNYQIEYLIMEFFKKGVINER